MVLPTNQISFSDLRRVIGPNNANSISLGQCRPSFPPAYGNGIVGVSDTNIAMSQFQGKSKMNKGFTFRAFKGSSYTFTAGTGGSVGSPISVYDVVSAGAGGGGGGILVNGGGGGGGTGGFPPLAGRSGTGGTGYGAGGGGATSALSYGLYQGSLSPGVGAGGFVYIYLNSSELFTTSNTNYNCTSSGILKFIMIGGGATGDTATGIYNYPYGGYFGAGGHSGNFNYGNISVVSGTTIAITVGAAGGTTSIVVNGTTYSAAGGGGGCAYGGGRGNNGGNSGSGHQGSANFNNATSSVSSVGGYFADNISLFSTYSAFATGTTTDMTNLTKATNNILITNGSSTNFSVEWVGQFYPPTTGSYTFYLNSDDASYLWIGSNATSGYTTSNANINNGGSHGMVNVSYTITLTGGTLYPMRIQYGQGGGPYDLQFSFAGPSISLTYNMDGYVYN